jgi:hypothetical protein
MAYKQSSRSYQSQSQADYIQEAEPQNPTEGEIWYDTVNSEYKKLTDGLWIKTTSENSDPVLTAIHINGDIKLVKTPKSGTITVTRMHTEYGIEIPLFSTQSTDPSKILEGEYYVYEDSNNFFLRAYVPANIKLPTDNAGSYL